MAEFKLTRNTRTRKKDIIEQFGFKKIEDGHYKMKLKGIFEDHPQDYLNISLNLNKAKLVITAMPYYERIACNSTLYTDEMMSKEPEWLENFFNSRIQWAIDDVHQYVYEDMTKQDYN